MVWFGLKEEKVGMIRQNKNVIDGINLRVEAKRFTHKTMQKKITSCYFPWSKFSCYLTQVKVGLKRKFFSNI